MGQRKAVEQEETEKTDEDKDLCSLRSLLFLSASSWPRVLLAGALFRVALLIKLVPLMLLPIAATLIWHAVHPLGCSPAGAR